MGNTLGEIGGSELGGRDCCVVVKRVGLVVGSEEGGEEGTVVELEV